MWANFTATELNYLNVLFVFNKLSKKKVPCCVLTSSLFRRFLLFRRQVNGQAFTLRQPQVFETKHLQILQFYLRSLTISLLVLWFSIVVTQSNLQVVWIKTKVSCFKLSLTYLELLRGKMHKRRSSKINRTKQISYPAAMPYRKTGFFDAVNRCHSLCFCLPRIRFTWAVWFSQ